MKCEYCGAEENWVNNLTSVGEYIICCECKEKLKHEILDELIASKLDFMFSERLAKGINKALSAIE